MDLKDKRLGLTPHRIEVLNTLGINTAEEALSYYPFRYDILNKAEPSLWKEKDKVTFEGTVSGRVTALYVHGKNMAKFDVLADEEIIHIMIFNRPWAKQLKDGDLITVTGIYNGKNRVTAMTYNKRSLDEQAEITPVYSVKAGIQQRTVRACMERVLFAMH
ncbi:MAG: ATP-dependent DNA helicase RecG, partial [Solobacterium sp.]|nr:ATP-dependent DNA helicase RecG [Solobacterium sp.]